MSNAEAELAFAKVKPYCVKVSQRRDAVSVQQLCEVINQLSCDAIGALHEYLLFPLRVIFLEKVGVKEDAVMCAADCMQSIVLKSKVKEWKTFEDLCQVLLLQISGIENERILAKGSEDKKISVLNALLSLLETSLSEHSNLFYHVNHIPAIGHIVSICLSIVADEKHKRLRKIALSVIKCFCFVAHNEKKSNYEVTRCKIGNCMASFVPGILSALIKVVSGDNTQGHAVKCKALETISELLKITAGDLDIELASNFASKEEIFTARVSSPLDGIKVTRNSVWVENLSSKMTLVLRHVMTATDNPNSNVRLAVLQFSNDMLVHCCKYAFHLHIGTLLQIPCKLLHDKIEKVSLKCRQVIDNFSSKSANDSVVTNILQEEMFVLCSNLPKTLAKSSDQDKLHCLNLIIGILELLKYNLKTVLYSSVHVDNLIKSLVYCFEMDCSELYRIEEVAVTSVSFDNEISSFFKGQSKHWLLKKNFVHFHNEEISEALVKFCRLLGRYGDLEILIDNLKDRYEIENQCRPVVVVISEILLGATKNVPLTSNVFEQIDCLLDIYTANENWYLCTSYDSLYASTHHIQRVQNFLAVAKANSNNLPLKAINSNILLACLHLEALAIFSVVSSQNFRDNLIKSLYPVLEKVSDGNHLINSCALKTLSVIARSCQYKSVAELINENADYLVSTISIHLRHLALFPRCPAVLQAMLAHCDLNIFPLVRDTVDEILFTMDSHRLESRYLFSFLPVLLTTVKAINVWFTEKTTDSASNQTVNEHADNFSQISLDDDDASTIAKELNDFHANFRMANMETSLEESTDDSKVKQLPDDNYPERLDDEFGEEKDCPAHIKVVEQVVRRCAHLLANENPKVRLIVMNVIDEAILCLSNENNVLLPLVHKLWGPLTTRCTDSELQVVAEAFRLICNLGDHSGTFLRRKFSKDVLPKLLTFLGKYSKADAGRTSAVTYSHTTLFKLQVAVLKKLGPLLLSSTVSVKELHAVCCACQNYLSSRQPKDLQNASVYLFKCLIDYDPDAVWFFLSDIYSSQCCFKPQFNNFNTITVAGTQDHKSEFACNVSYLLSLC